MVSRGCLQQKGPHGAKQEGKDLLLCPQFSCGLAAFCSNTEHRDKSTARWSCSSYQVVSYRLSPLVKVFQLCTLTWHCFLRICSEGWQPFCIWPHASAFSNKPLSPSPPRDTPNAQGQGRIPAALHKLYCFWSPPVWSQKSWLQVLPQVYKGRGGLYTHSTILEDLFAISPPPLCMDSAPSTSPTTLSAQSLALLLQPPKTSPRTESQPKADSPSPVIWRELFQTVKRQLQHSRMDLSPVSPWHRLLRSSSDPASLLPSGAGCWRASLQS